MMKQVLGGSCSPARSVPLLTVLWFACLWHENSYVASGELNIDLFLHKYFSFYFLSEETTCWQRLIAGILVFVCFVLFVFLFFWFCFCFCFVLCNFFFFPFPFRVVFCSSNEERYCTCSLYLGYWHMPGYFHSIMRLFVLSKKLTE